MNNSRTEWRCLLAGLLFAAVGAATAFAADPVTLAETSAEYILANGIVTARVAKASGDLVSLRYGDREMLATFLNEDGTPDLERDPPGFNHHGLNPRMTDHQYGFWSHDAMGLPDTAPAITSVTIDPAQNGGERAEVSVKGIAEGRRMGTGPGAGADGDVAADVEIRYALGRGDSGVYTYSIFEHQPGYRATSITEARFCAKLNAFFDWMSLGKQRDLYYPKELHTGDKYIFTSVQWANPAFGWSSTAEHVGFYLLNPTTEYLSGGPTKVEFLGHRDTNAVGAPCVLNYWRSSHYGGAEVVIAEGEHWTKVIGPFLLYVNAGETPADMIADARAQQQREREKWPYDWVRGAPYANHGERGRVRGALALHDPLLDLSDLGAITVGLAAPAYASPRPDGPGRMVTWQIDAKHDQFWVRANADGTFDIPAVSPGTYALHAIADGVLGEFTRADVVVKPGETLDLGRLNWVPLRHGRQLWDIGIPNRNASEFLGAEDYTDPEISLRYPKLFPDDVRYVIGESDFRKDWFFQHVPHNEDPDAHARPYVGVVGQGRATPHTIVFDLPEKPRGTATLRLAICGTGARTLEVAANGEAVATFEDLRPDGVITRHGLQGIWYERTVDFDAARLRSGENTLSLTVPAGRINDGLVYDYLRLELDEAGPGLPSLFIAGDSTAADGRPGAIGWGRTFGEFFDPARVQVVNHARGGRSSRTFISEGLWEQLIADVDAGDIVLIQFGHNDGGPINGDKAWLARGSLPGLGEEVEEIDNQVTGQHESVYTFGHYLRTMIADVRDRGARPILLSLTVRNIWEDGRVERGSGDYGEWTRELAQRERVPFIDVTKVIADRYEAMGEEAVAALFPRDHTHTSAEGAALGAECIVGGLKGLRDQSIIGLLSAGGRNVLPADPGNVSVVPQGPPRGDPVAFRRWLNLAVPGDPALPSILLIGDSTVRNGRGDGYDGQFGWGDPFAAYFDPTRVNVVNRAVGGTGARTFRRGDNYQEILPMLRPGDVVIMQFGHNDNGPRGALPGIGPETEERPGHDGEESETVLTFGGYLRQYVAEIRARGAVPVICSLVPRKIWKDEKIARATDRHADWARRLAEAEGVAFIDLHERIAQRYDALAAAAVEPLFADQGVHTSWAGAVLNAACVIEGLDDLPDNPVRRYYRTNPSAAVPSSSGPGAKSLK